MKRLILLLIISVSFIDLFSQPLTGIKTIKRTGGNYNSFASAINALNTIGVGMGGVTFNVDSGFVDTAANLIISTTTSSQSNPVVFQKHGSGINPKIVAAAGGGITDGIIKIAGSDFIIFDGINLSENSSNTGMYSSMEWGYAILKGTFGNGNSNGSKNIIIKNCAITLSTSTGAYGIYMANHLASSQTIPSIGDTNGLNSRCSFYNDSISNTNYGIYLIGEGISNNAGDMAHRIGVEGGNWISVNTDQICAIYASDQINLKIANNSIIGSKTTTMSFYGIDVTIANNASIDVYNNLISVSVTTCYTDFTAILIETDLANTINVFNNHIQNSSANITNNNYSFYAIKLNGVANIANIYGNTISNNSVSNVGEFYGISTSNSYNTNVYSNRISDNQKSGTYGNFYGYKGTTSVINFYNNIICNNTLSTTCVDAMYGYFVNALQTYEAIYGNKIFNLNHAGEGTVTAISSWSGSDCIKYIYSDSIYNLSSGLSDVDGIQCSSGKNIKIFKNHIFNLNAGGTNSVIVGLNVTGSNAYIYNNFITDLNTPVSNLAFGIYGIYILSGTNINLYYNTVFLNSVNNSTSGFSSAAICNSSLAYVEFVNNIFVNISQHGTTGKTVVYRTSANSLSKYSSLSNNNCFYAGAPGTANLIYYDGTIADQTISSFKNRVIPRDYLSFSEYPPFINSTTNPYNLHLNNTIPTQCESGGIPLKGVFPVTYDIDSNTRNSNFPDVGADEGNFSKLDYSPPVITFDTLANTSSTSSRVLAVTIKDPSGLPSSANSLPRLYQKINHSGTYTSLTSTPIGNDKYSFTFGSGVSLADTEFYYIVAQDSASTPNAISNPVTGASGYSITPPACSTPPTNPWYYKIIPSFSAGTYRIGGTGTTPASGCQYVDITDALNAISGKEITGDVTLLLTNNYQSIQEASFPIVINPIIGSNDTNTFTIKPDSGITTAINGASNIATIQFNGADNVVIDGSNDNSSARNLLIQNTTNNAGNAVICLKSAGSKKGCSHNQIINCTIKGASYSTVNYGISVGGNIGSAGNDNDDLTIQNNVFLNTNYGIYIAATISGINNNINITSNIIGDTSNVLLIGKYGIYAEYIRNLSVSKNSIINMTATIYNPTALYVGNGVDSSSISKNTIRNIYAANLTESGGKGIDINSNTDNTNITISNNQISDISGRGSEELLTNANVGIRLRGVANGINLFYNSVNLSGITPAASFIYRTASLYIGPGIRGLNIINNSLSNSIVNATSDAFSYVIISESYNPFLTIDYNNYYASGTQGVLGNMGYDIHTLVGWKMATQQDNHSISGNPNYVSNSNLYPTGLLLSKSGTSIGAVTTDHDDNARDTITPDIGAFEFALSPIAITGSKSSITSYTAIINGIVNARKEDTTSIYFDFGTSTLYGNRIVGMPSIATDTNNVNATDTLTGLYPNSVYHYRVVAINVIDSSFGSDSTFHTAIHVPLVHTDSSGNIGGTTATLFGTVNAQNMTTNVAFQYDTTTSYNKYDSASQSPTSGVFDSLVSVTINGLIPNYLYHFRVKATNGAGTVYGNDTTFRTLAIAPSVITSAASTISDNTATLNGKVNPNNTKSDVFFQWGLTPAYGNMDTAIQSPLSGYQFNNISYNLTGLQSITKYYYRIYATNAIGTNYGNDTFFTTLPSKPTVTTDSSNSITSKTAKIFGTVNTMKSATSVTIQYGTTTSYGYPAINLPGLVTGTTDTIVSGELTGLLPNLLYHCRFAGTNAGGTTYGNDMTFMSGKEVPKAVTLAASSVYPTSAVLNASVNANNDITTVTFQYGLNTSYGSMVTAVQSPVSGNFNSMVSYSLTGLISDTTYHYRVVAQNSAGITYGKDTSFFTSYKPPVAVTKGASPVGVRNATLNGLINAMGVSTSVNFDYGTTSSYGNSIIPGQSPVNGNINTTVYFNLTGLVPNTTYHYRVAASNIGGSISGKDTFFTTLDTFATIITSTASSITKSSATSGGNITDDGGWPVTARGVVWSTSTLPVISLSTKTIDGIGTGSFTSSITNLDPDTKYYYRSYATTNKGTAYGNELFFKTQINGLVEDKRNVGIIIFSAEKLLHVNISSTKFDNGVIIIQNLLGQEILRSAIKSKENQIDLTSYSSGYYIVKVLNIHDWYLQKILID